jgi:hypothetical protein
VVVATEGVVVAGRLVVVATEEGVVVAGGLVLVAEGAVVLDVSVLSRFFRRFLPNNLK